MPIFGRSSGNLVVSSKCYGVRESVSHFKKEPLARLRAGLWGSAVKLTTSKNISKMASSDFESYIRFHMYSTLFFQSQKKAVLRKNPGNYLQIGRSVAPTLSRASFAKYNQGLKAKNVTGMSFIVVRHPFERLVSAYR